MYRHILVPTDGSTLANKAVAEGVKLASALSSRLTFLTLPFASRGSRSRFRWHARDRPAPSIGVSGG